MELTSFVAITLYDGAEYIFVNVKSMDYDDYGMLYIEHYRNDELCKVLFNPSYIVMIIEEYDEKEFQEYLKWNRMVKNSEPTPKLEVTLKSEYYSKRFNIPPITNEEGKQTDGTE